MKKLINYLYVLCFLIAFQSCDETLDKDFKRAENISVDFRFVGPSGVIPLNETDTREGIVATPVIPINGVMKFIDNTENVKSRLWKFGPGATVVKPESLVYDKVTLDGEQIEVPARVGDGFGNPLKENGKEVIVVREVISGAVTSFEAVDPENENTSTEKEVFVVFTFSAGSNFVRNAIVNNLEVITNSNELFSREIGVGVKPDVLPTIRLENLTDGSAQEVSLVPSDNRLVPDKQLQVDFVEGGVRLQLSDNTSELNLLNEGENDAIVWNIENIDIEAPIQATIGELTQPTPIIALKEKGVIEFLAPQLGLYTVSLSYLRDGLLGNKFTTLKASLVVSDPKSPKPTIQYIANKITLTYEKELKPLPTGVIDRFSVNTVIGDPVGINNVELSADSKSIIITLDAVYGSVALNSPVGVIENVDGVFISGNFEKPINKGENLFAAFGDIEGNVGATANANNHTGNFAPALSDATPTKNVGPLSKPIAWNQYFGDSMNDGGFGFSQRVMFDTSTMSIAAGEGFNGSQGLKFELGEDDAPWGRSIILPNGGDAPVYVNIPDEVFEDDETGEIDENKEVTFEISGRIKLEGGPEARTQRKVIAGIYNDNGSTISSDAEGGKGFDILPAAEDRSGLVGAINGEFVSWSGTITLTKKEIMEKYNDNIIFGIKPFRTEINTAQKSTVIYDDFAMWQIIPNQN